MKKRYYMQPVTKVLPMVTCKNVCEEEIEEEESLYGPPLIEGSDEVDDSSDLTEAPLF